MARPRSRNESPEVSTSYMCEFFDVTRETISEWTKNGMPKVETGAYNLKAAFDWWQENINKDDDDATLTAAKRKYWMAKAEKEHLQTQQLKKELIPRPQLVTDRVSRVLAIKKSLLALSTRLESALEMKPRKEIRERVDSEIKKMLEDFSRPSELWPEESQNQKTKSEKTAGRSKKKIRRKK